MLGSGRHPPLPPPFPQSLGLGGLAATRPGGHCSRQWPRPVKASLPGLGPRPPTLHKEPGSISAAPAVRGPERGHGWC